MRWKLPLLFFSILLAVSACTTKEGFQSNNLSYIYNPTQLALRPYFVIYHKNDTLTEVHYRIESSDLLYVRNATTGMYESEGRLDFSLVPSFEETNVLDSGTVKISDSEVEIPTKTIVGQLNLKMPKDSEGKEYVLRVKMLDVNRKIDFENFIRIDKTSEFGSQYFKLTDTAGHLLFTNHIAKGAPFQVKYAKADNYPLYISYYERDFPLALPPYSSDADNSFELEPDTTFLVNGSRKMSFVRKGFYHLRLDTTQWQGVTVYNFYDQFPYVATRQQMVDPLRYLTTRREYDALMEAKADPQERQKWIDNFWLDRAGSAERSRVLVREYYDRVIQSNLYFTSYLEGWKTDRGIIYTIYGPPNKVYRSSVGEAWVYGDEASPMSYYFNFVRVSNPFTQNDYALERYPTYRYGWGQAIESWRSGHVYNSKDIKREQDQQQQSRYNRQRPPYWY